MAITAAHSIPTLPTLYSSGALRSTASTRSLFRPSKTMNSKLAIWRGDITELEIDVITNAANTLLLGGGGVDGAIHHAAGPSLLKECRTLNGAKTGESKMTGGYNLPAKRVSHTPGPIWGNQSEEEAKSLLANCYKNTLDNSVAENMNSVAFCCISTAIYRFPVTLATHVAMKTVREFLESDKGSQLDLIVFVVFSDRDQEVYHKIAPEYFPPDW